MITTAYCFCHDRCSFDGEPLNEDMRRYETYRPWVSVFAVLWSFGIPLSFLFLVSKYKHQGKVGDPQVISALAWIYQPFRDGKECPSHNFCRPLY